MDIKICKGIFHPEGVELCIEDFRVKKVKYTTVDGEKRVYISHYYICRKCQNKYTHSLPSFKTHRKKTRAKHWGEIKVYNRKYYHTKSERARDKQKLQQRERSKLQTKILSDEFIYSCFRAMKMPNYKDISSEFIKLKRRQLLIYREIKNQRNAEKGENNTVV